MYGEQSNGFDARNICRSIKFRNERQSQKTFDLFWLVFSFTFSSKTSWCTYFCSDPWNKLAALIYFPSIGGAFHVGSKEHCCSEQTVYRMLCVINECSLLAISFINCTALSLSVGDRLCCIGCLSWFLLFFFCSWYQFNHRSVNLTAPVWMARYAEGLKFLWRFSKFSIAPAFHTWAVSWKRNASC